MGSLATVIPSLGTDVVLHATGVFPPLGQAMADELFLLSAAYRVVYGIAGGYIAAWLAPYRPMMHALALGVVGLVLSTAGAAATWNGGPAYEPKWFPLSLIAIAIPCAWAGGKIRSVPSRTRAAL